MAAITLLLLWLFLFLFFDRIYYDRQKDHIEKVGEELNRTFEYNIGTNPEKLLEFDSIAKNQNLIIYVFIFNKNLLNAPDYAFPSNTKCSFYTPYSPSSEKADIKLGTDSFRFWTTERQKNYLSCIDEMGEDDFGTFTYVESNDNKLNDTLFCGGRLRGYLGPGNNIYYCLISTISSNNYTVVSIRNVLIVASIVILLFSVALSMIFAKHLANPINKLAFTADKLALGDYNVNFDGGSFTEVEKLAASLNFAKDEMKKTEQMRRDFIANISHDLRTPLTMIRAYGEMIRDLSGNNEEKRTKHCQIIIDESVRLSSLVEDIQKLSKLQSGTDSFEIKSFDLSELCKTVVNRFGIMSETQGYIFECDCDNNALCQGDYSKIEQVLYNLISNAVNYTGEDKKIFIICKDVGTGYKVEIKDTGKGIDPEEIDFVWDRYYRANQKKRNIVGSGLGLNIVKIILDGHKAEFGVESELNKGTSFWFILPKAVDEEEAEN